jgi:N utilization substance protein B
MKYIPEVDLSVSINEAVELSKRFSTQESFRFINGVLGKLANVFQGKVPVASPDALPDVRERGVAASEELRHV